VTGLSGCRVYDIATQLAITTGAANRAKIHYDGDFRGWAPPKSPFQWIMQGVSWRMPYMPD
jgi:hypothetical protein